MTKDEEIGLARLRQENNDFKVQEVSTAGNLHAALTYLELGDLVMVRTILNDVIETLEKAYV